MDFVFISGGGELATLIKSLEEIKLGVTEIKEEMHETKQDIKHLKQDNQPQVSKSYTDLGANAIMALNGAKLLKTFNGEGSRLPSIMTEEDLRAMASLSVEYESNCYVQCKLIPHFRRDRTGSGEL